MNVILGGGISGLIWAYYNPEYMVITKDLGGQMVFPRFDIGPRYLHCTENSKKFLEELNFPINEKTVKVGYADDQGYVNPDSVFRQKYYMKSRRKKNLSGFDETVMNSNKSEFQALDVNFIELIKILIEKLGNRFSIQPISKIDLDKKEIIITKNDIIHYDHLVSTIPLPIFCDLINTWLKNILEHHSVTYCLVDKAFTDTEFDFEYDCSYSSNFHRITKTPKGFVLDILGEVSKKSLKEEYCYIDHLTLNSQIISLKPELLPRIDSVKFIGRYGTWNRSWKTDKVIDEAINWRNNETR